MASVERWGETVKWVMNQVGSRDEQSVEGDESQVFSLGDDLGNLLLGSGLRGRHVLGGYLVAALTGKGGEGYIEQLNRDRGIVLLWMQQVEGFGCAEVKAMARTLGLMIVDDIKSQVFMKQGERDGWLIREGKSWRANFRWERPMGEEMVIVDEEWAARLQNLGG